MLTSHYCSYDDLGFFFKNIYIFCHCQQQQGEKVCPTSGNPEALDLNWQTGRCGRKSPDVLNMQIKIKLKVVIDIS